MALKIRAFANSDDAFIVWRSDEPIEDCIGFELRRIRNGKEEVVRNRVKFSKDGADPTMPESSTRSPIRRFTWTDHEVSAGDKVSYRVTPVIQPEGEPALVADQHRSPLSKEVELTGKVSKTFECYFNRGLLISQFMSRFLKGDFSPASLKKFKDSLNESPTNEQKIRVFLGGDLRARLFELLDQTKKGKGHVFAALFELSDEVLIEKLASMKKNAHIVLSNGPHKSAADDSNKKSRKQLKDAGCDVQDRMLASGVLGHNKILVLCDAEKKPLAAWTGSTNWSPTGLCTQINNGIVINDVDLAQFFLDQWARLKSAGNKADKALADDNSTVRAASVDHTDVDVWFTRTSEQQEMDAVIELVENARDGILFLMFQPGKSPILNAVVKRQGEEKGLFVKGVISTVDPDDETVAQATLVQRNKRKIQKFRVVQPVGVNQVGKFAAEISRSQFLSNVGFAIVHSKVIVIDANSESPIVITGSHNFSGTASSKNDENLVILKGNAALAQAYSAHVQSIYDHYNFRAVAAVMKKEGSDVVEVMSDPKSWQAAWFNGDKKLELEFWLGSD